MSAYDERIDYFLMLTRLLSEAEAQLGADAADRGSVGYAEDLEVLREAIQSSEAAAARIALTLITSKRATAPSDRETETRAARH